MDRSNFSTATRPALDLGVLFILAFALIAGTRPVRGDDPGSDDSLTHFEIVSLVDAVAG